MSCSVQFALNFEFMLCDSQLNGTSLERSYCFCQALDDQPTCICSLAARVQFTAKESGMRKIILSALVCAVCAAPAVAKDAKLTVSPVPDDVPAPQADGQQRKLPATQAIEDALRTCLGRAGYTDIEMVYRRRFWFAPRTPTEIP
jgi:hypothetical protein